MTAATPGLLTVVPEGGLCNRMRVARSAYALALATPWRVEVAWRESAECRCRWGDVFAPLAAPGGNFTVRPARWGDAPASRRNLRLPALLRKARYGMQLPGFNASGSDDIRSLMRAGADIYMSTCYEFFSGGPAMAGVCRPSGSVERLAAEASGRFGSYAAGFHIRATDNRESLRHSPYGLFVAAARRELAERPEAALFLATDSPRVRSMFLAEFGGRVVTVAGPLTRSTPRGMAAAAADLFALSRCNRIYGSHYSSFSLTAAELAGREAVILKL